MITQTLQVWLLEGADPTQFEAALENVLTGSVDAWHLGRNLQGSMGGDYTLDAHTGNGLDTKALQALPGVQRLDVASLNCIGSGSRAHAQPNHIWRTLLLKVKPGAEAEAVARFEAELLLMPDYITGIQRWALSRVIGESGWSHVWQQEFAQIDDLMGEYLMHPFHWGWIDRYFDADSPDCLVDLAISHNYCPLNQHWLAQA